MRAGKCYDFKFKQAVIKHSSQEENMNIYGLKQLIEYGKIEQSNY